MSAKSILRAVAVMTAIAMGPPTMTAQAGSGFEPEPVLNATDLVAADLLRGPQFTVDGRVPVRGFLGYFTIRSDFGPFEPHGIHLFQVRVREIHTLAQLEQMSKTKEFADAAARAIARPVTSAAHMVANPVETVEGLPSGLGRLFDRVELGAKSLVGAATAPGATSEQKAAEVSERAGSITVDALGFEKERRDLAKSLGVDPYTTNPVLSKKLTDMAWVAFSGRLGIQAATAIFVPYSMAMSAVTITNTTVYDTPPGDLLNQARAAFAGTGAGDAQVQALMRNKQYSLSVLTALASGLQRLRGVNGLASVVGFAAMARTQDETRLMAAAVNMLARYHESSQRLAEVSAPGPIIGRAVSGTLVVPAPVDYVAWVERTARFAERSDLQAPDRLVWLSGRMSKRAHKELTARGWKVSESFTVAAER